MGRPNRPNRPGSALRHAGARGHIARQGLSGARRQQGLGLGQGLLPALQRTRQALACYVASGPGVAQG